ncbi:MAG TPA: cell division protein ZapE [Acidimicrobiales bacterium]|nr:cell division protein ZapE [Acidimicrobiales bacterium]
MGATSLTSRRPELDVDEVAARFVPPPRFRDVRFETYVPNDAHPTQQEALSSVEHFAAELIEDATPRSRLSWRRSNDEAPRRGLYLDGGFGVGKTHLLASLWHACPGPKAYASFAELTAFIGYAGMAAAKRSFASHRLIAIDEFELDDVANTLMAVTFLRAALDAGARVAATSNTLPDRLGEGRFSAERFEREIRAIAAHFEVSRIDGPDYRAASRRYQVEAMHDEEVTRHVAAAATATDDDLGDVLTHLRWVAPVLVGPMVEGLDLVAIRRLTPIANQGEALLFVNLIDELYDAEVAVAVSGCRVDELFDAAYRNGGFRKKYGRAESRLEAMLAETRSPFS